MFIKIAQLLLVLLISCTASVTMSAEDVIRTPNDEYVAPGHHDFRPWYQKIQTQLGLDNCCDEKSRDCGPVQSYKIATNGSVSVMLEDGKWHDVLNKARIFYVDTPDERAHACRQPMTDDHGNVVPGEFIFYCVFIPMRGV